MIAGNREWTKKMTTQELTGRVALITGAGRNIGREMALTLAAAGASVAVNARSNRAEADAVVAEIETAGGKAIAVMGDVIDPAAVVAMIAATVKQFGRLDILINNAAIRKEGPLDTMSFEAWRDVMGVILDGAFHMTKAALPHLKVSGQGAIINIGGVSAHTGAKGRVHVVTAKAGLIGMTKALAHDLSGDKITVNCVVPGLINTNRDPNAPLPSHHNVNRTLVGHLGTSSDIANAVRYLVGPNARYVTGQTMHVNGGAYLA
jgi:3-oxoacyl-[acyl-carrier protein] reductase